MPQLEAQKTNNNKKFISTVDRQLKEFTRSIIINNNTYSKKKLKPTGWPVLYKLKMWKDRKEA